MLTQAQVCPFYCRFMKTVLASYNSPEMKKAPLKNTTAKTCTGDGLD